MNLRVRILDYDELTEAWSDGKCSIKRAAMMLASVGDQSVLSDFQIVEAKLLIGSAKLAITLKI